jgi:hypothetical protein
VRVGVRALGGWAQVLQADDEHKSSLLVRGLLDLPPHRGPWQVEVAYALEAPHPLLSGLLPWLPARFRPTPRRTGPFATRANTSRTTSSSTNASSFDGGGDDGRGWLRGEVFEAAAGPMRVHAVGSP